MKPKVSAVDARVIDVPHVAVDAVLRRAPSLQRTREGKRAAVGVRRRPGRMSGLIDNALAFWQWLPGYVRSTFVDPASSPSR